jgi:hypothetical protein
MNKTLADRMYYFATYLKQLNGKGEVKRFSREEKGYAKVVDVRLGCSIWFHLIGDSLTVSLRISGASEKRYPSACGDATGRFRKFFNNKVVSDTWRHGLNQTEFKRYYIDVTDHPDDMIINILDRLRKEFTQAKRENAQ